MYRRESSGWGKHYDFIILDLICLQLALLLSYVIRGLGYNPYVNILYRRLGIFLIFADMAVIFTFDTFKNVLKKGYYRDFVTTIKQAGLVLSLMLSYLFLLKESSDYSRQILLLLIVIYVILAYVVRESWKRYLRSQMKVGVNKTLLIVTTLDIADHVIDNIKANNFARYKLIGIALTDAEWTGGMIRELPIVADSNTVADYVCQQWVDEVFVNVDETYPYPQELIEELLEMGMPVHVNLAKVRSTPGQKQFVEAIGGYTVLTTTMNYATDRQALAKRVLDILGGLVGCFLTGIIFIFIAPAIYISSPGPIFFSQTRIGKNGKPFKMYKFRSMYMDAEERKAELMAQNKMSDGRMFKLDFDPRVIGNKILPDGTRKTGIGEFIRKTSLDEFPQFWNVLNGSMSLVGTRPILQDELLKYELHHRARIAIKPGITGMWQVSGRSDITDFEEVVRLDTEYISNWNFGLDIKILFKTVMTVLKMPSPPKSIFFTPGTVWISMEQVASIAAR